MGTAGGDRRALPGWMLTRQDSATLEPVGKLGSNPAGRGVRVASGRKGTTRKVKTRTSKTSSSKLRGGSGQPIYCMSESELLHTALQFLPDISDTGRTEVTGAAEIKGPNVTTEAEHRSSESEGLPGGTVTRHSGVTRPSRGSEIGGPRCPNVTRPRQNTAEDEGMNVLKEIFFKK